MIDPRHSAEDPAYRFLINLLVGLREPGALDEARQIAATHNLDWDRVWALLDHERIAPIIYHVARRRRLLPETLLERCHQASMETALVNTLRLQEVELVLNAFQSAGIEVIVLKGLALIDEVYGNVALRPMLDADLLVRDLAKRHAVAILEQLDYERESPDLAPELALDFENELLFCKRDRLDWYLELHWSLFDSPYYQQHVSEDSLWSTSVKASIEGSRARLLSAEHQLLHLCGHIALHHRWAGLLWWNDVAMFINSQGTRLAWSELPAMASALDLLLPLRTVLTELSVQWQVPVPPELLESLKTCVPSEVELRQHARLSGPYRSPGRRMLDDLSDMESWSDRLRFVGHNLFPSATYMDARYEISHPGLRPVYYIKRWLKGVAGLLGPSSLTLPADGGKPLDAGPGSS